VSEPAPARKRVGYSAALAHREYRGLAIAQVVSECSDQIARIALAVLVYQRSHSAVLTSLTYGVSFIPLVLGGALLSPIADRWPRRRVMVGCNAVRACLVALIAIPGEPLWLALTLLGSVSLFQAPFTAARSALLPEILPDGPTYVAAVSLGRALNQVDQAAGFFLGGLVVAFASPRFALLLDATAYVVSLLIIQAMVRPRPAAVGPGTEPWREMLRGGAHAVFGNPVCRALVSLAWLGCFFLVLPEGVAVLYAHEFGGGSVAVGALTAAEPLGLFIGIVVLSRWVSVPRQADMLLGLCAFAALPLAATASRPPIPVAFVLWLVSGMFQAYLVPAIALFSLAVDPSHRGRASGVAGAGVALAQGISFPVGGAFAGAIGPSAAIAWFGVMCLAGVALLRAFWPFHDMRIAADRAGAPVPNATTELATSSLD
jgi:MFS family permease